MATPIRFQAILDALADVLRADAALAALNPTIAIEEDPESNFAAAVSPWLCLYLPRFDFPGGQPIAAMTRGRAEVAVLLHVQGWDAGSFAEAATKRDAALGLAMLALYRGAELPDGLGTLKVFTGGDVLSARRATAYLATADLGVTVETRMTT